MKLKILIVILVFSACGLAFWFTAIFRFQLKEKEIKVADKKIIAWVADTHEARLNGLQNIIWMPKSRGMLFVFDAPDKYCFWNKNTLIPLKLIFMRSGQVTEEFELNPIWKGKQTICPNYDADCVLEINKE